MKRRPVPRCAAALPPIAKMFRPVQKNRRCGRSVKCSRQIPRSVPAAFQLRLAVFGRGSNHFCFQALAAMATSDGQSFQPPSGAVFPAPQNHSGSCAPAIAGAVRAGNFAATHPRPRAERCKQPDAFRRIHFPAQSRRLPSPIASPARRLQPRSSPHAGRGFSPAGPRGPDVRARRPAKISRGRSR